jgi:hypothetical protein
LELRTSAHPHHRIQQSLSFWLYRSPHRRFTAFALSFPIRVIRESVVKNSASSVVEASVISNLETTAPKGTNYPTR